MIDVKFDLKAGQDFRFNRFLKIDEVDKSEKDERHANRGLADDERAGITDKLEGRLQEEKDLRRFGNKGRDFEAKVDSSIKIVLLCCQ